MYSRQIKFDCVCLFHINSNRDGIRKAREAFLISKGKAREAFLISKGKTLEPYEINRRDET